MLEQRIAEWRTQLERRRVTGPADLETLESRLRHQLGELRGAGLDDDEAFLVAARRLGADGSAAGKFTQDYAERLWLRPFQSGVVAGTVAGHSRDAWVAVGLAVLAAVMFKLPELFGIGMDANQELDAFYVRNFGFFAFACLAAYFAWKRSLPPVSRAGLALPFAAGLLVMNGYPFASPGSTQLLASLHLPIVLWFAVGYAYAGGDWRDHGQRMNFVRFSGEWFIQYTLIGLGGAVLMLFTLFIFGAIGVDPAPIVFPWLLPCGVVGAVVIAAWLVEAKQGVIGNMAPVLTLLFTPLFTLALLAFLATVAWTGSMIDVGREVLIGFDLLLVLVLGLILYAISARDPNRPPGFFDVLQLALVLSALLVNALALWAILARISTFGFTPNRVAALGENLILVLNLAGSAWLYGRFIAGRSAFGALERWQTTYLPVYATWAALVVLLFPPLFGFE